MGTRNFLFRQVFSTATNLFLDKIFIFDINFEDFKEPLKIFLEIFLETSNFTTYPTLITRNKQYETIKTNDYKRRL